MSHFEKILKMIPYDEAIRRRYPEKPNPDQSAFAVDNGRIIFSNAFRLLDSKTQVILRNPNAIGPVGLWTYRSRRDHTQEVVYTARRITRSLGLNSELAEVLANSHDLGHPPYGHAGEIILDAILKELGESGFDHDIQTLRIITKLERVKPGIAGLNLTQQILTDLASRAKRSHNIDIYIPENYPGGLMSLEAEVLEFSDKKTFIIHDLEDLIRSGMMSWKELSKFPLLTRINEEIKKVMAVTDHDDLCLRMAEFKKRIYNYFLSSLYRNCADLLKYVQKTRKKLKENGRCIFITDQRLISCEPKVQEEFEDLLQLMYRHIYKDKMKEKDQKTEYTIRSLFDLLKKYEGLRNTFNQFDIKPDASESLARHLADLIVMSTEDYIHKFFQNAILA